MGKATSMTPERLRYIIDHCRNRANSPIETYAALARFLHVHPLTIRRWLSGERPIPRAIELLFEIHCAWPEVNAASVQALIDARDARE